MFSTDIYYSDQDYYKDFTKKLPSLIRAKITVINFKPKRF